MLSSRYTWHAEHGAQKKPLKHSEQSSLRDIWNRLRSFPRVMDAATLCATPQRRNKSKNAVQQHINVSMAGRLVSIMLYDCDVMHHGQKKPSQHESVSSAQSQSSVLKSFGRNTSDISVQRIEQKLEKNRVERKFKKLVSLFRVVGGKSR
jgi:hypothetical protein